MGAGQRGPGVCLRILCGQAQAHAHLKHDAEFGARPLGERRDPEAIGGTGQRAAGRCDQEAVLACRAQRGLDPLRLLEQQAVHDEPQLLAGLPGGGPAGWLPQRGHLDDRDGQLRVFQPALGAQQGGGPQGGGDRAAGRPHNEDRDIQGGQPLRHRFQAGDRDRRLLAPPQALMERGERRGAPRFLAHVHVADGQAHVGERVLDLRPAQHVHAQPGQVMAARQGCPQQGGIQGAAGQRHIRGGLAQHACLPGVEIRDPASEQPYVDAGAKPQYLVAGLLLGAVGNGHEPPGHGGRGGVPARGLAVAARPRCCPGRVRRRRGDGRAGQHDLLDEIVGADDADREFQRGVLPVGHAPVVTQPGHAEKGIALIARESAGCGLDNRA